MDKWDLYYDLDGKPTDREGWAKLIDDPKLDRHVAHDFIVVGDERVWVSTVWLGLNANGPFPDRTPNVFETMVFGDIKDAPRRFYSTREEAAAGHREVLAGLGYDHSKGLRRWKILRQVEMGARSLLLGMRRPYKRKYAWFNVALWGFVSLFPATSIALGGWQSLDLTRWTGWSNVLTLTFDGFMLYNSFKGLLWEYSRKK